MSIDLTVMPNIGIGPIRFGMSVSEVREIINIPFESFLKTKLSKIPTDHFVEYAVLVYYDPLGLCRGIELGHSAKPTFEGRLLIREGFQDVLAFFRSFDPNLKLDTDGFESESLGLSIWAPDLPDFDAKVESVYLKRTKTETKLPPFSSPHLYR